MEKENKEYKVSYKTYFNTRLQKVWFHDKHIHPLYLQVTFDRVPIIFKSYYFDLFLKPKYAIRVAGQGFSPDIKDIIRKEEELIAYIIEKNREEFSLELFKKEYAFYCRDLLDLMEEGFQDYLYTFLQDEGLPSLAATIKKGVVDYRSYDIIQDLKNVFTDKVYTKLIEHSFHYAPPYLPLYAFITKSKQTSLTCFIVMDWELPGTKGAFSTFYESKYPGQQVQNAFAQIQNIVNRPKRSET